MYTLASSQQVFHPIFSENETSRISRDVSSRDVSGISYLFNIPGKFSDTIVWLLYPFVVADMVMQPLQVTFSVALWNIGSQSTRRISSEFFVLQLFA